MCEKTQCILCEWFFFLEEKTYTVKLKNLKLCECCLNTHNNEHKFSCQKIRVSKIQKTFWMQFQFFKMEILL